MKKQPRNVWRHFLDRETEKPVLEQLYLQFAVATDQLRRAPEVLNAITEAFNRATERNDSAGILLRYMINRRKNDGGDWPKLENRARKFESVADLLTPSQIETLRLVYVSLDVTSDELLINPKLGVKIAQLFAEAAGQKIASAVLVAVVFAQRKRGLWPTIREVEENRAFGDIDEVARQVKKTA